MLFLKLTDLGSKIAHQACEVHTTRKLQKRTSYHKPRKLILFICVHSSYESLKVFVRNYLAWAWRCIQSHYLFFKIFIILFSGMKFNCLLNAKIVSPQLKSFPSIVSFPLNCIVFMAKKISKVKYECLNLS